MTIVEDIINHLKEQEVKCEEHIASCKKNLKRVEKSILETECQLYELNKVRLFLIDNQGGIK